jgi:ubiquinone biosynthesis protein UbiJ
MRIALDKFLKEIESLSPGFLIKIKNLYPLDFNIEIDALSKFSISLNNDSQDFNFIEHPNPNFSLQLNIFTALNALKNKQIPTKSISGDVESAIILLAALANIDIDLELLVYKYFGDIPALMLRKIMSSQPHQEESPLQQSEVNRILRSFRDISIRLDRLEHVLIN